MRFDNGYIIVKRYDNNEFSDDSATSLKIEWVLYSLKEAAHWDEAANCAIVNTTSINHVYKLFGRANVLFYLKRLVEKEIIEITPIGKDKKAGSRIKINDFPRGHLGVIK
jgi:hypothetical protein